MAKPTSQEPNPTGAADPGRWLWQPGIGIQLPRPKMIQRDFSDVLTSRSSPPGPTPLTLQRLSTILWHSCLIRERHPPSDGRRGWESRNSPAAGGLHEIEVLCLPLDESLPICWYDPLRHRLIEVSEDVVEARERQQQLVHELCGSKVGISIQFVADWQRISTLYNHAASLMWRDAGALLATFCLVAEGAGAACTPLGRESLILGVTPTNEPARWKLCGGVHLSEGSP